MNGCIHKKRGDRYDRKKHGSPEIEREEKEKPSQMAVQKCSEMRSGCSGGGGSGRADPADDKRQLFYQRLAAFLHLRLRRCGGLSALEIKEDNGMTDQQKLDALKMLLEGASYEEVGRKYCVSRQMVYKMFSGVIGKRSAGRKDSGKCVYPVLANWIAENCITQAAFADLIGVHFTNVSKFLLGKSNINKVTIDKILKATGMTYEECFRKEKAPEDAATSIKD